MRSERDIKKSIRRNLKHLNFKFPSKWVSYNPYPTGEPGTPDLVGVFMGIPVLFEVKTEKGKVSDIQKHRIKQWKSAGAYVYVVRSLDDVKQRIEKLKIKIKGGHNYGKSKE